MTREQQLALWIDGKSVHNDEFGECCPDFSCCQPDLLAPREAREAFARATEEIRFQMLGGFLSAGMSKLQGDKKVYVAGQVSDSDDFIH